MKDEIREAFKKIEDEIDKAMNEAEREYLFNLYEKLEALIKKIED